MTDLIRTNGNYGILGNMDKNIMIVKGAVLIPNIPDSVGDVLDEETIRKVSLIFSLIKFIKQ